MVKNWQAVFARVRAALMRRGSTEEEADELVHEAWIRLAFYVRENRVARPEAFLMRVALNLWADRYRAEMRRGEHISLEAEVLTDRSPTIEATVLARERADHLMEGLLELNLKTRQIFIAHRLDGMSYQEIARTHGISVSAVEKQLAKATLVMTLWMEGW